MFQLKINHCPQHHLESLSEQLEDNGALSITLTDQYDDPILEPAPGAVPLWPNVVLQALFAEETTAQLAAAVVSTDHPTLNCVIEPLPEQPWERVCLDQFQPKRYGSRLWICPSWSTPPNPEHVNLMLDPGLAFGTGSHATTALCLTWLDQADLREKHVIDYGCGSGILGLAALKLGAAHVYAVDIDDQALLATNDNAHRNHISPNQLHTSPPEALTAIADVLIANILLAPLLALKQSFYERLKADSVLVVSGLLTEQVPTLINAYQDRFKHHTTMTEDDWALVVFVRC